MYLPPRPGLSLIDIGGLSRRLEPLRGLWQGLAQECAEGVEPQIDIHRGDEGELVLGARPEDLETHTQDMCSL